jgi:hypothetical protein
MDKTTLVGLDLSEGAKAVTTLEENGIKLKVALWMVTPEYEDGRLVLASDALTQVDPLKDYERVAVILRSAFRYDVPPILILKTTDPFIRTLRRIFGKAKPVKGMRLGGQHIGDRYLEDAYVYRIA